MASSTGDRWELFVTAIAGVPITVRASGDLHTDGRTIYYDPAAFSPDGLAVQAALIAGGTFSPGVVAKLAARPKMRRRFLQLEALRASASMTGILPPRTVQRIRLSSTFPPPYSVEESLALAANGRVELDDAPDWMGVIKPARLARASLASHRRPLGANDKPGATQESEPDDDGDDTKPSWLLKLLQTPGGQRNPLAQYLQQLLGISRSSSGGSASGGDEVAADGHRSGRTNNQSSQVGQRLDASVELPALPCAPLGRWYPEWNFLKQAHRPDWCLVTEFDSGLGEERLGAARDLRLRRELSRLGVAAERHRRQNEGDALDLDAVIERQVDRRTGSSTGDGRLYERRKDTSHDLGVILLLDATGSTGESEDGKRTFDEQRSVLVRLESEFEALGVRVAVYAFRSFGRRNVQFLRIKRFDERHSATVERRLAAIEPSGFTRIGAAVRHGVHLAHSRSGAHANLLVVIGDGLPYDDSYEGRYAQNDSAHALSEAVDDGVAVACLSIRSGTDELTMKNTWGGANYAVLEDPAELARIAADLFMRSLKAATAVRRRT